MALNDLTRISTSGIATGSSLSGAILHSDAHFRGTQVGVTSALFDSSDDALEFNDNVKLKFGNSGDLEIYHNGADNYIDATTGSLYFRNTLPTNTVFQTGNFVIKNQSNNQNVANFAPGANGGGKIYHENDLKFQTTQTGAIVTGILTATSFSGPVVGNTNNTSGISTFYDLRVSNNLTVEGTTTTLDTNLIGVDRIEVGANSNSIVGVAITQSGTADILNLYDGSTEVFSVADGGAVSTKTLTVTGNVNVANGDIVFSNSNHSLRNSSSAHTLNIQGGASNAGGKIELRGGTGDNDIRFLTSDGSGNSVEKVRIHHNGNVGIGTDNPNHELTVYGDEPYFRLTHTGSTNTLNALYTGVDGTGVTFNSYQDVTATKRPFIFKQYTTEVFRIASNGRVGIGSAIPANALDVQGTTHTKIHVGTTGTGHATGIQINHAKGNAALQEWQLQTDGSADGNLKIRNATSSTDVMFFDADNNNIGVNITAPETLFHIEQDNAHSSTYYLNTDAAILVDNKNASGKAVIKLEHDAALVYGSGSASFIIADRENERLRITSNGTVHTKMTGTAPSWLGNTIATREKFSIFQGANFGEACFNIDVDNANSFLSHNMYYDGGWKIRKSGSPVRHLEIGTDGWKFMTGADGSDDTGSALTERFRISGSGEVLIGGTSEKLRITGSGDVGISSTSPRARLDVKDANTGHPVILRVSADNATPYALVVGNDDHNTDANNGLAMWVGGSKTHHIQARTSETASENALEIEAYKTTIQTGSSMNNDFVFNSNGRLKIGSGTPKATLDIKQQGNSWEDALLIQHDNANTGWNFHAEQTNSALWIGYNSNTGAALADQNASQVLHLHSNRTTSLVTSNNSYELTIGGIGSGSSGGPTLWLRDSGTSGSPRIMFGSSGGALDGAFVYNISNNYMAFYTNGTEHIRIDTSGHFHPITDATRDLGKSDKRWRNVYTTDLQLSNENTGGNEVDGTEGNWTLQEGESDIYMINRKTGKKYKMMLQEVS